MESVAQDLVAVHSSGSSSRIRRSIVFAFVATILYFSFLFLFIFHPASLGPITGDTLSIGVVAHPVMIVGLLLLSYYYLRITDRVDGHVNEGVRG